MDVAFKKLNITFPDENKSITAVEPLLFNPTILQAIDCIHKKRKHPDDKAVQEHLNKTVASNLDKETIGNIISELINQSILKNKNSSFKDTFYLKKEKEQVILKP